MNAEGGIRIGAGNDIALKTLNAVNSMVTCGKSFNVLDVGLGFQQAAFIPANSTVTFNGTGIQTITSSTSSFNDFYFI